MVQDRHYHCMLFLIKSANTLTLTDPLGQNSVSVELKEKQKHLCSSITQHISVNHNLILSVFFGCPSVPSYETIAVSMMMSMAIVLQTVFRLVICIERTLKPKSQTDL